MAGSADFTNTPFYTSGDILDNVAAITVSCWVNSDDLTSNFKGIFTKGSAGQEVFFLQNDDVNGVVRFRCDTDLVTLTEVFTGALSIGVWYFFTGTCNTDDDTIRIYTDGVQDDSKSVAGNNIRNSTSTVKIATSGFGEDYNGRICFAQGWVRELSPAEIIQSMYMPGTVPNGMELYLQLMTANATEVDLSGNGNDAVATGSPGTISDGPPVFLLGGQ